MEKKENDEPPGRTSKKQKHKRKHGKQHKKDKGKEKQRRSYGGPGPSILCRERSSPPVAGNGRKSSAPHVRWAGKDHSPAPTVNSAVAHGFPGVSLSSSPVRPFLVAEIPAGHERGSSDGAIDDFSIYEAGFFRGRIPVVNFDAPKLTKAKLGCVCRLQSCPGTC